MIRKYCKILATTVALSFICGSVDASARELNGKVTSGRKGVAGVVVSDGSSFATTDSRGRYRIGVSDDADLIYVVVPSGYSVDCAGGTPKFYSPVKARKHDFSLVRNEKASDDYDLIVMADPQMRGDEHLGLFTKKILPDLCKTAEESSASVNTVGIALGDIAWNTGDKIYPAYKKAVATIGVPFYPVTGNHDYLPDSGDDRAASMTYRESFGPQNYAFGMGKDYVVVLDDVIFGEDNKYVEGYSEETLSWLRGFLELVPKSSRIILAQHCPLVKWFDLKKPMLHNAEKLIALLEDRDVVVVSGHNHISYTLPVTDNIIELNTASACGAWWTVDHCTDGTPAGYRVLQVRGGELSWYYKSAGHEPDYQMELAGVGAVPYLPDCITANVWDWNPDWTVSWYEDGRYMGAMEMAAMVSPTYCMEISAAYKGKDIPAFRRPSPSYHCFKARPSAGASSVTVVATDGTGRSYSQTIGTAPASAGQDYASLIPMNQLEILNAHLGRIVKH